MLPKTTKAISLCFCFFNGVIVSHIVEFIPPKDIFFFFQKQNKRMTNDQTSNQNNMLILKGQLCVVRSLKKKDWLIYQKVRHQQRIVVGRGNSFPIIITSEGWNNTSYSKWAKAYRTIISTNSSKIISLMLFRQKGMWPPNQSFLLAVSSPEGNMIVQSNSTTSTLVFARIALGKKGNLLKGEVCRFYISKCWEVILAYLEKV